MEKSFRKWRINDKTMTNIRLAGHAFDVESDAKHVELHCGKKRYTAQPGDTITLPPAISLP